MIVYHVAITATDGYRTRREAERQADVQYLAGLRARGAIIAAGAAPDGLSCDLFCRIEQPDQLGRLVEGHPFFRGGLWTGYAPRSFAQFLEPWALPPPSPETRIATIVEGAAPDPEMASFALIEARGAGRLLFAGFFPGGELLALMTTADPADAVASLDTSGLFAAGTLRGRPLLRTI